MGGHTEFRRQEMKLEKLPVKLGQDEHHGECHGHDVKDDDLDPTHGQQPFPAASLHSPM